LPEPFLELPSRSTKPRKLGITHVLDKGLSLAQAEGLIEVAAPYIDYVKLGWGTALVTGNLKAKLDLYRQAGIVPMLGGTLTELAIREGRLAQLCAWLEELGIDHIEVSDGTISIGSERKQELIAQLSERFTVFSEVGSKDVNKIMAPYRWVAEITAELAAGAARVVTEARESGTAGIFRPSGEVRSGLIDEIVHAIDPAKLIFEAPRREQQVWFLLNIGRDCNLGNVPPEEVVSLETLRLGLRSETIAKEEGGR